jgi:uncharacterized protein (DUF1778 family)
MEARMARTSPGDDDHVLLQMPPTHQARIARAAAIQQIEVAQFVIRAALREADAVIAQADTTGVSMRDFTRILELLENPPAPNPRVKAAIAALPDAL